jgi:hypothetical protein
MIRALTSLAVLILTVTPLASDTHCGNAYTAFLEHMWRRAPSMTAENLARANCGGLRIFDACDTGHLENAEQRFGTSNEGEGRHCNVLTT